MNSQDWISNPKWDSQTENVALEEINKTFKVLGNSILDQGSDVTLEHNAWACNTMDGESDRINVCEENKEVENRADITQDNDTMDSKMLLSKLAPENNGFNLLGIVNAVNSPKKEDALFAGVSNSPLNVEDDRSEQLDDTEKTGILGCKKHVKVERLFSTSMMRRNPLTEEEKNQVVDPLAGEFHKYEESVDERFNKNEDRGDLKKDLLEQMDGPLFEVARRKSKPVQHTYGQDAGKQDLDIFKIEVVDPVKVKDLPFSHVEYTIRTEYNIGDMNVSCVKRRFKDFRWLYRQLQSNHWGRIIPPPPEKQTVGRFKQDFIENRRFQMEKMLQKISQNPILQKDQDFIMFLKNTNFNQEAKVREQITGSRASSDNSDTSEIHISELALLGPKDAEVVIRNGGLENESSSGFMGISFVSIPKYSEPDPYFIDKRHQMETLEEQLKQMFKSLELVDAQKNDLVSVTNEFASSLDAIVSLETSKKISTLLADFASVHLRITESLQRSSFQDSLTLGITIDEYIRSLGSMKAAFNQRAKLGHYLVIVETDLTRKETQLSKLSSSTKTSGNKIEFLKQELETLQRRHKTIKDHWEAIAVTIRQELPNYFDMKIADFRNNMEIYLESAIETQKECIELWETFYQNSL